MRSRILVINRASVVRNGGVSRSVEERLLEPLCRLPHVEVELVSENAFLSVSLLRVSSVVLNRPHSEESLRIISIARKSGLKVIIDVDDLPIYYVKGDSAYLTENKKQWFLEALASADTIVCSTEAIRLWVNERFSKTLIQVIPTGYDFAQMDSLLSQPIPQTENSLVFTNTGTIKLGNFRHAWLETMKESLNRHRKKLDLYADFLEAYPEGFPYRYLGNAPWLQHKGLLRRSSYLGAVVPLASSEDREHLEYAKFKTPIKFIIYGGLGIPAIYSRSPIYEQCVVNGETGYLVENTEIGWQSALESLITNRNEAERIRKQAFEHVRSVYDIDKCLKLWAEVIS